MKLLYLIRFSVFSLLCSICFESYSQLPGPEILSSQRESLENAHQQNFGDIQDVLSGREHRAIYHFTNGHPFWKQKSWILGSVTTNLHYYPGLTIRYDLYRDVLLFLPDSLSVEFFALNQNQVLNFTLDEVSFINLGLGEEVIEMEEANMKPGYYEWVYRGKTNLFAKNEKELKSKNGDSNAHSEFYDKRTLYINVEDHFHLIKRKKNLLNALNAHRSEMKSFIRKNHLNIRKINDLQFTKLLRHYDSL